MNNSIKLLLFNILICSAPAMQAMGALRNFGARTFKAASASAAKFKANAQAFKLRTPQIPKTLQIKKPYAYKLAAISAGMGLYGLHEKMKKKKFEENHKKLVDIFNCQECCPDHAKHMFDLYLPEGKIGKEYEIKTSALKKRMGLKEDVMIYFFNSPNAMATKCPGCDKHAPHAVVLVNPDFFKPYSSTSRDFVIAHELAHAQEDHEKQLDAHMEQKYKEFVSRNPDYLKTIGESLEKAKLLFQKQMEYEADKIAALQLGQIEGSCILF